MATLFLKESGNLLNIGGEQGARGQDYSDGTGNLVFVTTDGGKMLYNNKEVATTEDIPIFENKDTLNKLSEADDGTLLFNGESIGSIETMADIKDVEFTDISDNNLIAYDSENNKFINFVSKLKVYKKDEIVLSFGAEERTPKGTYPAPLKNSMELFKDNGDNTVTALQDVTVNIFLNLIGGGGTDGAHYTRLFVNNTSVLRSGGGSRNRRLNGYKIKRGDILKCNQYTDSNSYPVATDCQISVISNISFNDDNTINNLVLDNFSESSDGTLLYKGKNISTSISKQTGNIITEKTDGIYANVDLTNYYTKTEINTELGKKVNIVSGKGLSTNDFTNELKESYDKAATDSHSHENKEVIDKFSVDVEGNLLFDGGEIGGGGGSVSISQKGGNIITKNSDGIYAAQKVRMPQLQHIYSHKTYNRNPAQLEYTATEDCYLMVMAVSTGSSGQSYRPATNNYVCNYTGEKVYEEIDTLCGAGLSVGVRMSMGIYKIQRGNTISASCNSDKSSNTSNYLYLIKINNFKSISNFTTVTSDASNANMGIISCTTTLSNPYVINFAIAACQNNATELRYYPTYSGESYSKIDVLPYKDDTGNKNMSTFELHKPNKNTESRIQYYSTTSSYAVSGAVQIMFAGVPSFEEDHTDMDDIAKFINVYSTDETVIGTWIDGRTIYRKVFNSELLSSTTTLGTIDNIDKIVNWGGTHDSTTSQYQDCNFCLPRENSAVRYNKSNSTIIFTINTSVAMTNASIWIEYIKTTD